MKYKLTWKDIIVENFVRLVIIGFPVFIVLVFLITLLIQFFTGELGGYTFWEYITGFYSVVPSLIVIYICALFLIVAMSFSSWKKMIIGEHELIMDEEFFIWKSARGEVKTKLNLFKDFSVKRKHIVIKFDGMRKAKIAKKWIQEGYEDFIADMTKVLNKKK